MPWNYKLTILTSVTMCGILLNVLIIYERLQIILKTDTAVFVVVFVSTMFMFFMIYFLYLAYKKKISEEVVYAVFFTIIMTTIINFIFLLTLIKHFIEVSIIYGNEHFIIYKTWYPHELYNHALNYCKIYKISFEAYKDYILRDSFSPEMIERKIRNIKRYLLKCKLAEDESILQQIWRYIRSFF